MPRELFRALAVLVLVLTIPVQGIAAVVNAQCMAFGHQQDVDHHSQQGHAHDDAGDHGHGKAPAQPQCGPCAACCAAAVAAAAPASVTFDPVSSAPCCSPSELASVSLDTPDRPPLVG